ncbi:antirepressor regulating drug resistance protein [Firmicutes bacterium CAG:124]|nr:antirepressor regulating drug resistance protein [Firmicutes bacterium CAG:124]
MLREVLTVSALILAVLLVRAIFKNRVPKRMVYALWLVVLVKLCLPGTLVSLPVLPAEEAAAPVQRVELPAQPLPAQQPAQAVAQPQTPVQQPVSPAQGATEAPAKPLTAMQIFQIVWAGGSALLGLWLFGTWLVFMVQLHKSRRFLGRHGRTRIYISSTVKSPCLAGLVPAVYLTEDVLQTDSTELILRHELTHLRHLDFLWSLCRTAAVIVYWWNPFIWLAAICSKRDAELACDEAVAAGLSDAQRLVYARAILAQAPRKAAALSLAGPPVRERILFLTKKQRTSALCVILALLLIISAAGCSLTELTRQKSGEITLPEETEPAQQEPLKTAMPLTQAQIDEVNAIFADYELSTDDTLGHFAVNGFFTSTYDDVRDLNLNNFLAYFGECGEEDISEEEFAQLNAKWEFRVDSVEDFPLPIHRYPASAVEGVLKRFAGIGLADLTDMQTPFSGYTYLEDTDAFYTTTSDYSPGYFRCTSGEIEPDGDTALLYGSTAGSLSGKAVLKLVKDGENWYIHSFTLASPEQSTVQEEQVPTTEPQSTLPTPTSSLFGLTGREAVLFDAAVAQRYPRDDNDIVLPSLREYGSFEENGKTVVICDLHYDFYYDYTGPDWEWNGGGATTVARFELDAPGNVCTGFAEYPSGNLSDWIRDFCGPLAVQNADGAWVLPEASGDWFPADMNLLQQYLEVIASLAPSSGESAEAVLQDDTIWSRVHEKLDYAHWAQDMTAEYEDIVRKFQIEDSKMSDLPGDVSQWPRYYSAFVDYFSAANADLRYLDADTIWTKDLSEDRQSLIVTLTRADVILMLSYSLQTSQITEVSTRRNAVLQSVTGDSITAEHITLLNASLEEDLQTLKALNIPPQNYYYGYYRVDSGELYTYKVDPNASVTIYDIEQEYGAGEDRLYTFKTWRDFAAAVQENEGLLVQPYTLTLKNGVVVKIEEKFYH